MKKILLIAVLLGGTILMAESSQMNKTMKNLEVSMAFIQKGFLYNHRGRIEKGITSLREELKNISSFVIEHKTDSSFDAHTYAATETKAIDVLAARILEGFDAGHKEAVLVDFQQMLNRCVTCHALVRKW